jgi:prolyl-tRNA synthetase
MKKYELTSDTKIVFGHILYRIKALSSFGCVSAGDLGGFLESEKNLSQNGDAWVYGDAEVYGDARVYGDAEVSEIGAIFWIGAIGSRNDTATFFRCRDGSIKVVCGCFFGNLDEFAKKVRKTHGDNDHAKVYMLAIDMAKIRISTEKEKTEE